MEHNKKKMELFSDSSKYSNGDASHSSETHDLIDSNKRMNSSLGVADSIIQYSYLTTCLVNAALNYSSARNVNLSLDQQQMALRNVSTRVKQFTGEAGSRF